MITIYLPVVVLLLGLILFLATEGKPSETGRIMFIVGLVFTLWKGIG